MPAKISIAWIIALLILDLIIMILFPEPIIIVLGIIALPILILVQVYFILKEQSLDKEEFNDNQWYQKR